jgi:hypothetical protein
LFISTSIKRVEETTSLVAAEVETEAVKTAEVEMSGAKTAKGKSASRENLPKIFAGSAIIAIKLDIESVTAQMSMKLQTAVKNQYQSSSHDFKRSRVSFEDSGTRAAGL